MGRITSTFPYVSLYETGGRYRLTTARIGGRRVTRRLGVSGAHARRYAATVSDWIQQWKGKLITEAKLLQLLGQSLPIGPLVEAYRQELVAKGRNAQYVRDRTTQLRVLFERAGIAQVKQLTPAAVVAGIDLLGAEGGGAVGDTLAGQTVRYYLSAARQFGRWLDKKGFVERDPLEHVEGMGAADKVHGRRAPTALEARLLVDHLWTLPRGGGRSRTSGRDRAILYLFAMTTGMRVGEIRQLRHEWIDAATGVLHVPETVTKNGKAALQPLPTWLVTAIAAWHGGGVEGGKGPLFGAIPGDAAAMLRRDQAAARAAWVGAAPDEDERKRRADGGTLRYRTAAGVFDFHALRHYYVTTIGRSGATVKDTQTLARHSTPMLTLGTYSHTEATRLRRVVDAAFADPTPNETEKGGGGEAQAHRAAQSGV